MDPRPPTYLSAVPWLIGASLLFFTILLWQSFKQAEHTTQLEKVVRTAKGIQSIIQSQLKAHIRALNRMADRWGTRGDMPYAEWQRDAHLHVHDLIGYQAIEWIDTDFMVRWIEPLQGNEAVLNMPSAFDERRKVALEDSRDMRRPVLTDSINLIQGGKGFLCYIPIHNADNNFLGFILGVFRVDDFINEILRDFGDLYNVRINDTESVIYQRFGQDYERRDLLVQQNMRIENVVWVMQVYPTLEVIEESHSRLPTVILLSGITIAGLVTWIIFMGQRSAARANQARNIIEKQSMILERSNRELETFAYAASHDLKAPLRHMITYADFLAEDFGSELPTEGKEFIDGIQKSGKKLQNFIDSLLNYSQVGGGRLKVSACDLNDVVAEVLDDLEQPIAKLGVTVKVAPLPTITGDPILFKQVFQNLIGNSIKYLRPDVPLRIDISCALNSLRNYEIVVSDNGTGFDSAFNEKVFEPFRRLVSGDKIEGAGIGLSTVKKIVEMHHGSIVAHGQLNVGVVFTIIIPREMGPVRGWTEY